MDYFVKPEKTDFENIIWNIPERKQGIVNVIGGNAKSFRTEVKIAEFLASTYPLEQIKVVLPDTLQNELPKMPNFVFLSSNKNGSFEDDKSLKNNINQADYNLILGDLSKNSVTGRAISNAIKSTTKPTIVTRDTVDLIVDHAPDEILANENVVFVASMPQLIKLFRAVYYPKMLLLSQSLMQVVETLHKFTLSFQVKIVTLHSGQIIVAENGKVIAIPLEKTDYSPITVWGGELAARIAAINLYNPSSFIDATAAAFF